MRYVISDIHGCYEEFLTILEKINFSSQDHLYILGDVVDRGPHPIKVLQDIMQRDNVTMTLGNHDHVLFEYISSQNYEFVTEKSKYKFDMETWRANGCKTTLTEYLLLTLEEIEEIYEYLKNTNVYEVVEIDGRKYILVHAGLHNFDEEKLLEEYSYEDFIYDSLDYSRRYYSDQNTYIVSGHTPTFTIRAQLEGNLKGDVYTSNGHIAIDCGISYKHKLAAYCLETGECTYVEYIRK